MCKKWSQKVKPFWRILCKKNQAIWLGEWILGPKLKKQTIELLETSESFCCFYQCLPLCKKTGIISQFSLDVLQICYWNLILLLIFNVKIAWPHPYEWTESYRCIYVCLNTCKIQIHTYVHFLRYSWHIIYHLEIYNHRHTWPHPPIKLLWIPNLMQKANFIAQLIHS